VEAKPGALPAGRGHGTTEATAIVVPAGPDPGEIASEPKGMNGDSSTAVLLLMLATNTSPA
jgi:hypothetical protein